MVDPERPSMDARAMAPPAGAGAFEAAVVEPEEVEPVEEEPPAVLWFMHPKRRTTEKQPAVKMGSVYRSIGITLLAARNLIPGI